MRTKIILIQFIFFLISIPIFITGCSESNNSASLPEDFPKITVNVSDNPAPGFIFLSNFGGGISPYLIIINENAYPVFYRKMDTLALLDFKVLKNGVLSYYDYFNNTFVLLNNFFKEIRRIKSINYSSTDGHELRLLDNGNVIFLIYNPREHVDLSSFGGSVDGTVIDLVIQEIDPSDKVVWEWNSKDYFLIDDSVALFSEPFDYIHGNAIEIESDGNILLSSRNLSEITKIRRVKNPDGTGTIGEIIWRMGGLKSKHREFTFIDDPLDGFSYQHCIRRLPNGNIILYDNGNDHSPQLSRAVEYKIGEVNKTARLVWEYRGFPTTFSSFMGSVQRLSNGNTLINWGFDAGLTHNITEVRPDGSIALDISLQKGCYTYRAYKFKLIDWVWSLDPEATR